MQERCSDPSASKLFPMPHLAAISNATFYAGSVVERTQDLCHQPGLAPAAQALPAVHRPLHKQQICSES